MKSEKTIPKKRVFSVQNLKWFAPLEYQSNFKTFQPIVFSMVESTQNRWEARGSCLLISRISVVKKPFQISNERVLHEQWRWEQYSAVQYSIDYSTVQYSIEYSIMSLWGGLGLGPSEIAECERWGLGLGFGLVCGKSGSARLASGPSA